MQLKKCVDSPSHINEELKALHIGESINDTKAHFIYFESKNGVIIVFGMNFRFVPNAIKVKKPQS
jgi:hypothetical protein